MCARFDAQGEDADAELALALSYSLQMGTPVEEASTRGLLVPNCQWQCPHAHELENGFTRRTARSRPSKSWKACANALAGCRGWRR